MRVNGKIIRLLIILVLLPFTDLKIHGVKIYEFIYLVLIYVSLMNVFYTKSIIKKDNVFYRYLLFMILFIVLSLSISSISFFRDYYVPSNSGGFIYKPIVITFSRVVQLIICIYIMSCIYYSINRRKDFENLLSLYLYIGVIICLYGIFAYFINKYLGANIGGVYDSGGNSFRIKGTFVEGGPFGIYVISLVVIAGMYFKLVKSRFKYIIYAILFLTLVLTKSKAAILLMLTVYFVQVIYMIKNNKVFSKKNVIRIITISIVIVIPLIYSCKNILIGQLKGYYVSYINAKYIAKDHVEDGNFAYGRVAGAHIIPNMIRNHPFTGIGLGNYPLVRNNLKYRLFFPEDKEKDLSGLGIFEIVAEVGLPLGIMYIVMLFLPLKLSIRNKLPAYIIPICIFQVFCHFFGVQVTFVYPYVVTSIFFSYLKISSKKDN